MFNTFFIAVFLAACGNLVDSMTQINATQYLIELFKGRGLVLNQLPNPELVTTNGYEHISFRADSANSGKAFPHDKFKSGLYCILTVDLDINMTVRVAEIDYKKENIKADLPEHIEWDTLLECKHTFDTHTVVMKHQVDTAEKKGIDFFNNEIWPNVKHRLEGITKLYVAACPNFFQTTERMKKSHLVIYVTPDSGGDQYKE